MAEKIKLPSGAELSFSMAPFADAKELYQIIAKELKEINLDMQAEVDGNFFKGIACTLIGSKEFETATWVCMSKCLYNGVRFDDDTFEDEKAREDYLEVLYIVAERNIKPFTKNLMQKYSDIIREVMSASHA